MAYFGQYPVDEHAELRRPREATEAAGRRLNHPLSLCNALRLSPFMSRLQIVSAISAL
jgi:hypothetical protein